MKRTYVDSGVLIAAARGNGKLYERAIAIIIDPSREFVSSEYVRFETVPKPTFFKHEPEVLFFEEFFARATTWFPFDKANLDAAFQESCQFGLGPLDSVHVVIAKLAGC